MHIRKDKDTLIRYLLVGAVLLLFGLVFVLYYDRVLPHLGDIIRFIGVLISPFAIAWLVCIITKPLNRLLIDKLHFPRTLAVLLVMIFVFALISALILLFISVLANVLANLADYAKNLSYYTDDISNFIDAVYDKLGLDNRHISEILDQFKDKIADFASKGLGVVVSVAKSTPGAVVLVFVTLVAVFYWCRDEEKVVPVLCNALPRRWREKARHTYDSFSHIIGRYIRAQLILISISFLLCTIGFTVLGVKGALAMGLFTAVLDIIPVLGPGTLMVPWAIWSFITDNVGFGIGLLVLYAIVSTVRYILEPKIVGDSVGLHPLAALAAVFIGMKMFGIVGLILGPITLAVIMAAYRSHKAAKSGKLIEKIDNANDSNCNAANSPPDNGDK